MDDSQSFTWVLHNFKSVTNKQKSEPFEAGGYFWRLTCYQRQNEYKKKYVALFLEYPAAADTPKDHSPSVECVLTIANHKDALNSCRKVTRAVFAPTTYVWGCAEMLSIDQVSVDSGYLRHDGAIVVSASIQGQHKRLKAAHRVGEDLLVLFKEPEGTSDLTLTAGGRSFAVHRAILAARCPYFKTMFASGFADSAAKEHDLPEADPDALDLLLRAMYGGILSACPRKLLKPAAELADRLQLTEAYAALKQQLEASSTLLTVVDDMLWAAQHGDMAMVGTLEELYLRGAHEISKNDVTKLLEQNPKLTVRLHLRLASKVNTK